MSSLAAKMQAELSDLAFMPKQYTLTQFNGGAVNRSYCLDAAGQKYFLKTFDSDHIAKLNRQKLFEVQQQLAKKQIAVNPVYLSKNHDFQIEEWVDAPTLEQCDLPAGEIVKKLASTLATIHSLEIDVPGIDLPKEWIKYQQAGEQIEQIKTDQLNKMADIWYQACEHKKVFCHNDLALAHVTLTRPSKIFDWEYCALSCPFFDLASCMQVNGLNATDQASLCAYYAQFTEQQLSAVLARVKLMQPLVEYTYRLWYNAANIGY